MNRSHRLALSHLWVSFAAFGIASTMAVMQAMSRASVQLPARTAKIYYISVTAHGVLMALVFTTFFIMGFGYVIARSSLNRPLTWERLAWGSFWVALAGTAMNAATIVLGKATVLYTFYPPLQAHPAFYLGATLLVVGSWGWCAVMIRNYLGWRRENPGKPTPLAMHGMLATIIVWILATVGIAIEVLVLLLPWSLGITKTIDPILARALFWWFGHPLVYFWLIPAYVAWYTILPRGAGGKLFSDPLARVVFVLFIVLSTPVGFHHQFMDPGIPAGWKFFHAVNTQAILFPSLLTAFTIIASLEVAGRMQGGRGWFGWLRTLPWGEPFFTSVILAMLIFAIGGFGGAINAAYGMNAMIHNTAWVQGHFHLTVGTAVALTFMGVGYWLLPRLTGRELKFPAFAQVQPWLWFAGMLLFAVANHVTGLMGMPRRVYDPAYGGAAAATGWAPWTAVSAAGGVILFVSAMSFVLVAFGTAFWGKKIERPPEVEYAEPLEPLAPRRSIWDSVGLWTIAAVVLVLLAYAYPLFDLLRTERFGAPGMRPF